jgi:hypothetical protein
MTAMRALRATHRLSGREIACLLVVATAIGVVSAAGFTVSTWDRYPPMRSFLSGIMSSVGAAVLLVACLAIASSLDLGGWRRTAAYVAAALIAAALSIPYNWYVVNELTFLVFGGADVLRSSDRISVTDLQAAVPRPLLATILLALAFMYFRDARQRTTALRNVQLEQAKVARDTYESRLRMAQARVDPQFLFDTLRQVQALYAADFAAAQALLDDLILFLRRALPAIDSPTSSVAAEVALANAWLRIAQARRGGALHSRVRVDADAGSLRLPPMLVLPIMQWAAGTKPDVETHVDVDVATPGDRLWIAVAAFPGNSGVACLEDIEAHLASLYGASASLSVHEVDRGRRVVLDLPGEEAQVSAATG